MNGQTFSFLFKTRLINLILLVWIVSIIVVVYLSLKTSANLPTEFWNADKIYHAGVYCWLAILPFLYFNSGKNRLFSSLSMICLGLFLETAQAHLPNRTFSVLDIVANSLGVFLGIWLGRRLRFFLKEKITT